MSGETIKSRSRSNLCSVVDVDEIFLMAVIDVEKEELSKAVEEDL